MNLSDPLTFLQVPSWASHFVLLEKCLKTVGQMSKFCTDARGSHGTSPWWPVELSCSTTSISLTFMVFSKENNSFVNCSLGGRVHTATVATAMVWNDSFGISFRVMCRRTEALNGTKKGHLHAKKWKTVTLVSKWRLALYEPSSAPSSGRTFHFVQCFIWSTASI